MQKGKLIKWNDEKGFGFIRPENSGEEIFFHISSLKRSSRRPAVGDSLHFNVVVDEKGRRKAVDLSIEGVKSVFTEQSFGKRNPAHRSNNQPRANSVQPRRYSPSRRTSRSLPGAVVFMVLVGGVVFGIDKISKKDFSANTSTVFANQEKENYFNSQFKCEGKTRCSQMTSCDEAMFYLNNCPGSVTDGDGDGRPCEDQWCGH